MKHYRVSEPGDDGVTPIDIVMSEREILEEYWQYWYGRMCDKFGKEHVDSCYNTDDCIDDWVVVHWAVEIGTTNEE